MNAPAEFLPGVVRGISNEAYQAMPGLSATGLKLLAKSPYHYRNRRSKAPTPAMQAGTLAHCALFEANQLRVRYAVKPETFADGAKFDGRTKQGKEWLASVPAGAEVVTEEQMETAERQAEAARALPEVAALLESGESEVSAFWSDPDTGIHCKCRPDHVSPAGSGVILVDLKTCPDASEDGFWRTIFNFRYHLQAAHYSDGYALAAGVPVLGFVFVAVEQEYPHAAQAFMLPDEVLDAARARNRALYETYRQCRASGVWPGYPSTIQQIKVPGWAMKELQT